MFKCRTRLDEESATKTQQENLITKLHKEIAKLKEELEKEEKQRALIDSVWDHSIYFYQPVLCFLNFVYQLMFYI